MRKHFVFICFYWSYPVFLDGESNIFQTQRRRDTEVFFLRTRNARKKRRPSFILYFPCSDKIFAPQRLCVQLIISCFRHLEKPIKTKEHKRKHFVFICFYWFFPVFQMAKAIYFKRRDAKPLSFLFTNTKCTRETEVFRISCFRHLEKPIKTIENKVKHFY